MDLKVKKRLIKGFSANFFNQGVTSIIQLVGVPMMLHAWGASLYGEWLIVFAIPAYLSMTDLGYSQSAANDMTAKVARGERVAAQIIFQSLIAFVFISLTFMLLLSTLLIYLLPLEVWLHPTEMSVVEIRWALWILCVAVLAQLPDGITHAAFRANGEYALHLGFYSFSRLFQFTSLWIAALLGGGPIAAAAAFCAVRLISTICFSLILINRHRWLKYRMKGVDRSELKNLLRPALANIGIPLAYGLNVQGMVLVTGAILGPLAVVTFSTLRTLTRFILQLVLCISHAVEPELAAAYGTRNVILFRKLYLNMISFGFWSGLVSALFLLFCGGNILAIWTNGKVAMNPALFIWLLGSSVISIVWYSSFIVLKAANSHLKASSFFVISSGAGLVISALLMLWTGKLAHAGIALLSMDMAMVIFTIHSASHLSGSITLCDLMDSINPFAMFKSRSGYSLKS